MAVQQQQQRAGSTAERALYGGVANALAGVCTNPADVLKVRLQLQNAGGGGAQLSLARMAAHVVRTEGPLALMSGWQASVMREMSYSAIRMGLYDEVKALLSSGDETKFTFPLHKKILAGGLSGGVGAAIATPTDLLKVRMQALNPATGAPFYSYPNPWTALGVIYSQEGGLAALYRGVGPTVQRAVLLTAAQFGTYDEIKYTLLRQGLLEEGPAAHFVASTLAGLAVATTTNPIDVVKTRIMNQPFDKATGKGQLYSGVADCLAKTVRAEGLPGLYKGWLPCWLRIGPHTMITFITFEAMRKLAGLGAV